MATWQFDCYVIPHKILYDHYGYIPNNISRCEFDEYDFNEYFDDINPIALFCEINEYFGENKPCLVDTTWGIEDSDRIDILLERNKVCDFFVRIDLRQDYSLFLSFIFNLLTKFHCYLYSCGNDMVNLNQSNISKEIKSSVEFKYVSNPKKFLDECT